MTRLILLHGFTQTARSWDGPAERLRSVGHVVESLDLPGHGIGLGPSHLVEDDLWAGAASVAARAGRGTWIGYSMGARLALHVALAHPDVVDGLVLLGGTAGIDDPEGAAQRRASDDALARRIECDGLATFLERWLAQPLFALLPADAADRSARLTNTAAGLASSLRRWGTGSMDPPLWGRLAEISAPTLVLAGSEDPKFAALGQRLAAGIGTSATFMTVPEAGHAAHLEQPEAFTRIVSQWLVEVSPR